MTTPNISLPSLPPNQPPSSSLYPPTSSLPSPLASSCRRPPPASPFLPVFSPLPSFPLLAHLHLGQLLTTTLQPAAALLLPFSPSPLSSPLFFLSSSPSFLPIQSVATFSRKSQPSLPSLWVTERFGVGARRLGTRPHLELLQFSRTRYSDLLFYIIEILIYRLQDV